MCTCVGPPSTILKGSTGVFMCNKPSARMGDPTAHGGTIVLGLPTVLVGEINMALMTPPTIAAILEIINPTNSVTNCADITTSVISLFRGNGPLVAPVGAGQTDAQINANNNTTIGPYNQNINGVFNRLNANGPGSVEIVTIDYGNGGGHVVVAANVNGQVGIFEGQNWGPGQESGFITDPAVANARYTTPTTTYAVGQVP
jgi:PAAR motif/Papain fold toxin 1, glutamine deamidase